MNTILNRYRLRREATAHRISAESAFSSPRLLLPLSISPRPSITQPERDEALRHPPPFLREQRCRWPTSITAPIPLHKPARPPNLNLFRWDSFVFAREFSRDHRHGLAGYLLDALGLKVSIESLSIRAPKMMGDDPKGGPLQIIFLCHIETRAVLRVHVCARREVGEWVLGVVEALWSQQPSLPNGPTRAGPKDHPRTGQSLPQKISYRALDYTNRNGSAPSLITIATYVIERERYSASTNKNAELYAHPPPPVVEPSEPLEEIAT